MVKDRPRTHAIDRLKGLPDRVGAQARSLSKALPRSPRGIKRTASMLSSLGKLGWGRSADLGQPIDNEGSPLPWITYPALLWIEPRLRTTDRAFEFGSGNSTLWLAGLIHEVTAVEHDVDWAQRIRALAPDNVQVIVSPIDMGNSAYTSAIRGRGPFDLISIDGLARNDCAILAAAEVSQDGIIILDNSDRPEFAPAVEHLQDAGLGRIDFAGPVPGSGRLSTTSVFVRGFERWLNARPPLPHLGY